jgi:hypothetical protein
LKGEINTCAVGLQTLIGTVVDFVGSSTDVAFKTTVAAEEKTGDVEEPTLVQALPVKPTVTSTNAPGMFGDTAGVIVADAPPVVL